MKDAENVKKYSILKAFFKLAPSVIKSSPISFIVAELFMMLYGITLGLTTIVTQMFYDSVNDYVQKTKTLYWVIIMLSVLGVTYIISQVLNGVSYIEHERLAQKVTKNLSEKFYHKLSRLSPIDFENIKILDEINKLVEERMSIVWFILSIFLVLTYYIPYYTIMGIYLSRIKPIMSISLMLVFLPTLISHILSAKLYSKLEDDVAPVRRRMDYYEGSIVSRDYFKETRILGAFQYFRKLFHETLNLLNELSFKAVKKTTLIQLLMKLISLTGYLGILFMLFISLMNGEVSVGMFAAVFASVDFMFSFMEELVGGHLAGIPENLVSVQNYLNFFDLPEREGKVGGISLDDEITLKDISFTYPGRDEKSIDHVSFSIHPGETIAIVGENGSGKSTLVRLIIGLYLPSEGKVLYGDVETKNVLQEELFRQTSAVFQKYQRYQMTLRDNICISNVLKKSNDNDLNYLCNNAGLDISGGSFQDSYDTMLSKEFNGIDLSGGQWQRVSIARSYYRDHRLIVLDEPTASIDPIEETLVYNQFAKITTEKTAIIITHRIGSVKLADRIIVMKAGKLVEQGTHDELIKSNGEYARLFYLQEKWYKD